MSGHRRLFKVLASILWVGILFSLLSVASAAAHAAAQPVETAASLFIKGVALFFKGLLNLGLAAENSIFIALVIASAGSLILLFIVMKRSFKQSK